jgi:hypothetical protein
VFRDSGWTQIRPLLLFGGKLIFDGKNSRSSISEASAGLAHYFGRF